jgi:hypothetical protein
MPFIVAVDLNSVPNSKSEKDTEEDYSLDSPDQFK